MLTSSQICVRLLVPPVECLSVTVWNEVCAQFDIRSLFSHSLLKSVNLSSVKEGAGSVTSQTVEETSRVQWFNLRNEKDLHIYIFLHRRKTFSRI